MQRYICTSIVKLTLRLLPPEEVVSRTQLAVKCSERAAAIALELNQENGE
jgi:hypothetical protein